MHARELGLLALRLCPPSLSLSLSLSRSRSSECLSPKSRLKSNGDDDDESRPPSFSFSFSFSFVAAATTDGARKCCSEWCVAAVAAGLVAVASLDARLWLPDSSHSGLWRAIWAAVRPLQPVKRHLARTLDKTLSPSSPSPSSLSAYVKRFESLPSRCRHSQPNLLFAFRPLLRPTPARLHVS